MDFESMLPKWVSLRPKTELHHKHQRQLSPVVLQARYCHRDFEAGGFYLAVCATGMENSGFRESSELAIHAEYSHAQVQSCKHSLLRPCPGIAGIDRARRTSARVGGRSRGFKRPGPVVGVATSQMP
jgi:hypothetical protein